VGKPIRRAAGAAVTLASSVPGAAEGGNEVENTSGEVTHKQEGHRHLGRVPLQGLPARKTLPLPFRPGTLTQPWAMLPRGRQPATF